MDNIDQIIGELSRYPVMSYKKFRKVTGKYPKHGNAIYAKSEILARYCKLMRSGFVEEKPQLRRFLRTKLTRTISGVAPVTVLTKPSDCPGKCIFCPSAADQPKSYLSSEPGAARAKMFKFDPYMQMQIRIRALANIGHETEKIELIILGGTWSFYSRKYQLWFITQCFRAMNDLKKLSEEIAGIPIGTARSLKEQFDDMDGSSMACLRKQLIKEQRRNETAHHRCVGLVIETRPDFISVNELQWLRFLGVTKVQLGIQSLNDKLLKFNKRGHTAADSRKAVAFLRLAGFKIHLHWMFNLYKATAEEDFEDFKQLFEERSLCPDELKMYPCILLDNTELFELYNKGKYEPYSKKTLLELLIKCKRIIPKYCRVSRLFRDIPSFEIMRGVKETNFRQIVQKEMQKRGLVCQCIRCREIRDASFQISSIKPENLQYETSVSEEHFLSYVTSTNKIVGFLRLSLPLRKYSRDHFILELKDSAIIREVHVYGISQKLGVKSSKYPQHKGLGKKLISRAEKLAKNAGFSKIAVISAVGTRKYYEKRGYTLDELYMHKKV